MEKEILNFKPSQDKIILGGWQPHCFINGVVHFSKGKVFLHIVFSRKKWNLKLGFYAHRASFCPTVKVRS